MSQEIRRAVIIQSNYIPWKGYFDLLSRADIVVILDTVQSTKNDWRNRNQIKTKSGKLWLTVPIRHSNSLRINQVEVASDNWAHKHLQSISQAYSHAPNYLDWFPQLATWYEEAGTCKRISEINRLFIQRITNFLGIKSEFRDAETILTYEEHDDLDPTQRLIQICNRVGANRYLSGPAARTYLDESRFSDHSIGVEWFDYEGYKQYPQLHGDFEHSVSILDLLLMVGADARNYAFNTQFNLNNGVTK